ncbi:hypothetical protein IFT96_01505 [Pseudomonas fluorescens]|uniref:hypothetical protein n=1 Tax=Pseudomonas paracarnis TaxID=2750625 RepID=UPI001785190C|nr:hypothetical protein [Pseudomonas paracarnis]MBD8254043.1 hypothetical protein [Pseudomonas fluorescens]MBH3398156.1 hypothetical protein [Pseudomonas fluorescens]MDV3056625.1 hypothetical protein [Pseudomonas paracarnis]
MMRALISLMVATLVTACASVRHDTPEAQEKIRQDLKLTTIVDSSRMNWCVHPYGSVPGCQPEKGVGVVTPDGLVMAHLVEGKYVAARTLKSDDVVCSTVPGGGAADGIFFAFTKNEALMLGPLQADRDEINTRFKARLFDYLHSNGQQSFDGPDVNFQRPTGEKVEKTTVILAGYATRVIKDEVDVLEIYSPCSMPK